MNKRTLKKKQKSQMIKDLEWLRRQRLYLESSFTPCGDSVVPIRAEIIIDINSHLDLERIYRLLDSGDQRFDLRRR